MGAGLTERSRRLIRFLEPRTEAVILAWVLLFDVAAAIRAGLALSPIREVTDFAGIFLPYALAGLARVAGYRIAMAAFPAQGPAGPAGTLAGALRQMA